MLNLIRSRGATLNERNRTKSSATHILTNGTELKVPLQKVSEPTRNRRESSLILRFPKSSRNCTNERPVLVTNNLHISHFAPRRAAGGVREGKVLVQRSRIWELFNRCNSELRLGTTRLPRRTRLSIPISWVQNAERRTASLPRCLLLLLHATAHSDLDANYELRDVPKRFSETRCQGTGRIYRTASKISDLNQWRHGDFDFGWIRVSDSIRNSHPTRQHQHQHPSPITLARSTPKLQSRKRQSQEPQELNK